MSALLQQQMMMALGGGAALSFVDTVKADSPDAFWLLDEASGTTAANAMGASFPGTYSGVTLGGASLIPNEASAKSVLFANPSSIIIPGTTSSLRGSAVTYMIAFKHASSPSTYALLGNGISQPYLRVNGNKLDFLRSHVADRLTGSTTLVADNIYLAHVVVFSNGDLAMYLNGAQDAASTAFVFDYVPNQPFCIGADSDGSGNLGEFSETSMSHAAVWANTALTSAKIRTHAQAGGFA